MVEPSQRMVEPSQTGWQCCWPSCWSRRIGPWRPDCPHDASSRQAAVTRDLQCSDRHMWRPFVEAPLLIEAYGLAMEVFRRLAVARPLRTLAW